MSSPLNYTDIQASVQAMHCDPKARQQILDWLKDAYDAMESASIQLEHVGATYCSMTACPRCAIKHDIHRLLGVEPEPWPKCTNCHQAIDESAKYAAQTLCTTCGDDLIPERRRS